MRIDAREAHDRLSTGRADVYLDVRSTPEFVQAHPAGAYHVPLLEPDPSIGRMMPNPDFVRVVAACIERDRRIIVGCQSGMRSQQAAALLRQEGYDEVVDVIGGFGGERDPFGRVLSPSWAAQGFPVESGDGGERGYTTLKAKVGPGSRPTQG